MTVGTFLGIGFLLGIRHAFDADHLAAVTTLILGNPDRRDSVRIGVAWGLGHALMLLVATTLVMLTPGGIHEASAEWLEMLVGAMLILLGADVIWRAYGSRLHVHGHRHGGDVYHYHFHSHAAGSRHAHDPHRHAHALPSLPRAVMVGLVHGLAGSAALVLLTLSTAPTLIAALGYVALFGLGSVLGMGAVSVVLAVPFRLCAAAYPRRLRLLNATAGLVSMLLGAGIIAAPFWPGIAAAVT